MKKTLSAVAVSAICTLSLPLIVFAASNDVVLVHDSAVFTVNGIELDVTGSDASIESETINDDGTLTIGLQAGSYLEVTAPSGNVIYTGLSNSNISYITCNSGVSKVLINGISSDSVTISPSTSVFCGVVVPGSSVTVVASGNGAPVASGGGGAGSSSILPAIIPVNPTAIISPIVAGLSKLTALPKIVFVRGIQKSAGIMTLQRMLNSDPDTMIASVGGGSPGKETTLFGIATEAAIKKFQKKYGIVSSGTPATTGYGAVGPKTRAKLNELFGK